jgi:hypothetical protein
VQKGGLKEKKVWGPVMATRMSSRIQRDGKSTIEKAQELKKAKNLEAPRGMKKLMELLIPLVYYQMRCC